MNDDFECIAERTLFLSDRETKQKTEIRIQIGCPYWVEPKTEAACPLAIHGLFGRLPDIHGVDLMQALELAISFTENVLKGEVEKHMVCWSSGENYYDE